MFGFFKTSRSHRAGFDIFDIKVFAIFLIEFGSQADSPSMDE